MKKQDTVYTTERPSQDSSTKERCISDREVSAFVVTTDKIGATLKVIRYKYQFDYRTHQGQSQIRKLPSRIGMQEYL